MENDPIHRSTALAILRDLKEVVGNYAPVDDIDDAIDMVKEVNAVDAVEVVRCRDCINRDQAFRCIALYYGFNPHDHWFCANGKRDAEVEE